MHVPASVSYHLGKHFHIQSVTNIGARRAISVFLSAYGVGTASKTTDNVSSIKEMEFFYRLSNKTNEINVRVSRNTAASQCYHRDQ
jgi:hypothetical protein